MAILYCEKIRDLQVWRVQSASRMKEWVALRGCDELDVVGFISCGGRLSLVVPKMRLFLTCLQSLDRGYDSIDTRVKELWKLEIAQSESGKTKPEPIRGK